MSWTAGLLTRKGKTAEEDAPSVARMKAAGAICIGEKLERIFARKIYSLTFYRCDECIRAVHVDGVVEPRVRQNLQPLPRGKDLRGVVGGRGGGVGGGGISSGNRVYMYMTSIWY